MAAEQSPGLKIVQRLRRRLVEHLIWMQGASDFGRHRHVLYLPPRFFDVWNDDMAAQCAEVNEWLATTMPGRWRYNPQVESPQIAFRTVKDMVAFKLRFSEMLASRRS